VTRRDPGIRSVAEAHTASGPRAERTGGRDDGSGLTRRRKSNSGLQVRRAASAPSAAPRRIRAGIHPAKAFAIQEFVCHAPSIPSSTSRAADARPLPNNNPAPSCRRPPRTSTCNSRRCRNFHDNATRARTRERTSIRSAI